MLATVGALCPFIAPAVAPAATTATTTFNTPGQYLFSVPAGVRSLTVTSVGGAGGTCASQPGSGGETGAGGQGAAVAATVTVSPGEQLFVGVGGSGGACGDSAGAGGTGGGGAGGTSQHGRNGAGGGAASLVGVATPSPSFAGLLVVAGAGGGAAGSDGCCNLFDGGAAGSPGESIHGNPGGGAGTLTAGGAGGPPGGDSNVAQAGGAGSLGIGGPGGGCSSQILVDGAGGGGGGGYYGGGGGGCGDRQGSGGGGGSSFVVTGATGVSTTLTSASPGVSITYLAPTSDESTTSMHFGSQAVGTAGPAQVLVVKNDGSAPLVVSGVLLGGVNPDDFLIGDRCQQPVTVGSSCEIGVRFHPQVAGARSATLTLLTNAATAPPAVALAAGTSVGGKGPAGKVDLLSCELTSKRKHRSPTPIAEVCKDKVVRGTVKFTVEGASTRAKLVRKAKVFATGAQVATPHGGSEIVLNEKRALRTGVYTLILRHRHRGRWVARRLRIAVCR